MSCRPCWGWMMSYQILFAHPSSLPMTSYSFSWYSLAVYLRFVLWDIFPVSKQHSFINSLTSALCLFSLRDKQATSPVPGVPGGPAVDARCQSYFKCNRRSPECNSRCESPVKSVSVTAKRCKVGQSPKKSPVVKSNNHYLAGCVAAAVLGARGVKLKGLQYESRRLSPSPPSAAGRADVGGMGTGGGAGETGPPYPSSGRGHWPWNVSLVYMYTDCCTSDFL